MWKPTITEATAFAANSYIASKLIKLDSNLIKLWPLSISSATTLLATVQNAINSALN